MHLVRVHVRRRARAGLERVDRELVGVRAGGDLVGRRPRSRSRPAGRPAARRARPAFTRAASALISASARITRGSTGRPEIGKFSTARWVCAPHSASAGTRTSPIESCSTRYSVMTPPGDPREPYAARPGRYRDGMTEFAYQELLPLGADDTPYRLLTADYVSTFEAGGRRFLQVDPEALTLLTKTGDVRDRAPAAARSPRAARARSSTIPRRRPTTCSSRPSC